jgi:hypothetical protein
VKIEFFFILGPLILYQDLWGIKMRRIGSIISTIILMAVCIGSLFGLADFVNGSIHEVIDEDGKFFLGTYPTERTWHGVNENRILCWTHISWENISNYDYYYEFSQEGFEELEGDWTEVPFFQNNDGTVCLVIEVPMDPGNDKWVQFKADHSNDTSMISKPYNLWIDSSGPLIKSTSIPFGYYLLSPLQNFSFQLEDKETGINASSVQYSISTDGDKTWSSWEDCYTEGNLTNVDAYVDEHFRRGDLNYIRIRAVDNFGNQLKSSIKYWVWINTYPQIVIDSPLRGEYLVEDKEILFDASSSYDPDGDSINISWLKSTPDGEESLGDSPQVFAKLDAGQYTITVIVKDEVNNEVKKTFTITVEKEPEVVEPINLDVDWDRMPNWWETRHGLNIYRNDSMEDPDNDGYVNLIEYGGMSDPYDPDSYPEYPFLPEERSENEIIPLNPIFLSMAVLGILILIILTASMFYLLSKRKGRHHEE